MPVSPNLTPKFNELQSTLPFVPCISPYLHSGNTMVEFAQVENIKFLHSKGRLHSLSFP